MVWSSSDPFFGHYQNLLLSVSLCDEESGGLLTDLAVVALCERAQLELVVVSSIGCQSGRKLFICVVLKPRLFCFHRFLHKKEYCCLSLDYRHS